MINKYSFSKQGGIIVIVLLFAFASCNKEVTIIDKEKPEVIIGPGNSRLQDNDIHFVKDTVYILAANLTRNAGQVLRIDAGTLIKVRDRIAIEINSNGKIEASGTATEPIIFTSATLEGAPGRVVKSANGNESFWYGLSITGSAGVSSGNLNFVRIEFGGGYSGIPGEASLALYNTDSLTTIQNVQVSYSYFNPAFSFSGGNCNGYNLVAYATEAADFLIDNGYKGMLQNLLAYRHPYFSSLCPAGCTSLDLAGMIIRGDNTLPIISNLTILGPGTQAGTGSKYFDTTFLNGSSGRVAGLLVRGGKFYIRNSVIAGFPKTGFHIDNRASAVSLNLDESQYTYSITQCNDSNRAFFLTPNVYRPNTSADFRAFILRPQYHNEQLYNFNDLGFTDPFNYDVKPDPSPKAGSPLLSGANFDGANSFFKRVAYRGAVGTGADNWLQGWTNFIPLQTDYNN